MRVTVEALLSCYQIIGRMMMKTLSSDICLLRDETRQYFHKCGMRWYDIMYTGVTLYPGPAASWPTVHINYSSPN